MSAFQVFSAADIRKKIPMQKAIELMKDAFVQLSSGGATVPIRTVIDSSDQSGRALFMPSYSAGYNLYGMKMVSVFGKNETRNLPIIQGKMLAMDGTTGTPLALFDAEYLTALRTGAAAGLATEWLSRRESSVLALFGTGAQAETQLEGILAARPIKSILLSARDKKKASTFGIEISKKFGVQVRVIDAESDLKQADIICTATTSNTPVFHDDHLGIGVHINGIGSFKPSMQEIPSAVIQKSLLVVDQREAALSEAGDIAVPLQQGLITARHIHAELGEIISGSKSGRTSPGQTTVFKSVGNAIQDLAIAHFMLRGRA